MVILEVGRDINGNPIECFYNDRLIENLTKVKSVIEKKDFDYVAIITGRPGTGKSTFVQQLAKFFDPTFSVDQVFFSVNEFIQYTQACPKHKAVILDEAFESMNTRLAYDPEFLKIMNHLQIVRQRNLFLFLVLPSFFDLNKSTALGRAEHLFHTYGVGFGDRGRFGAWSQRDKRVLYVKGKRFEDYSAHPANINGKFTITKVIDWEAYEKKKHEHFENLNKKAPPKGNYQRDLLIKWIAANTKLSCTKIGEIIGLERAAIEDIRAKEIVWYPKPKK